MITDDTFMCPQCRDTYQMHWLDADGETCLSCAAERDGRCFTASHQDGSGHAGRSAPCSGPQEQAGDPCRYCGKPIAASGAPCPDCTISLEGMALADIKALFAGDERLTIGGLGSQG